MAALNSPRCGRGRSSFTHGWIRTRLSGETLLRRSAPTSIFRSSGATSTSRPALQRFHPGCHIFSLIPRSSDTLIPNLIGEGKPTFLLAPSHADVELSHSKNGSKRNCGGVKHRDYLVISTSNHC